MHFNNPNHRKNKKARIIEPLPETKEVEYVYMTNEVEKPIYIEKVVERPREDYEHALISIDNKHSQKHMQVNDYLELHSRALIGFKEQQLLDRKRRLQFIKKFKKEQAKQDKLILKLKLAVAASMILSLIALMWR